VAAGDSQVCALDTSGAAWCWGSPSDGAVGDGRTTDTAVTTPVRVAGTNRFAGLTAGFQATCGWTLGVSGSDGSSACWGLNVDGELGDGTTTNRTVPTPMAGTQVFSVIAETVADGPMHACALTASGQAYCWGNNTFGELGDGSTNSHLVPGPVTMP
jgi:alpha-tubulin suppressor-like RCC1 family protein